MADKITLFTITGLKSRVIRVMLGTPFCLVGGLGVLFGIANLPASSGAVAVVIGGIFALIGVYSYYKAMVSDTLKVKFGGSSSGGFE